MWTIFKVFIEFVTVLLLFYVLLFFFFVLGRKDMWDLSSPTGDRTHTSCVGRLSLNHRTTGEVPGNSLFFTHKRLVQMSHCGWCPCTASAVK